jgi:FtsH-binding integral membrane protein
MKWKTYGKTIAELLGALIMAGVVTYQQVQGEGVTMSEWVMIVIATFGVVNVWAAANISGFASAKTLVSALFVVLNLLVGFLTDSHLSNDEILLLVIQALSTLGVVGAPAPKQIVEQTVIRS